MNKLNEVIVWVCLLCIVVSIALIGGCNEIEYDSDIQKWIAEAKAKDEAQGVKTWEGMTFEELLEERDKAWLRKNGKKTEIGDNSNRVYATKIANKYGLASKLVHEVIRQESAWNPKAVSSKGARGLMQIMQGTGRTFCGLSKSQLFNSRKNIDCGVRYLAKHLREFGTIKLALCAYHAGEGKIRELGRCPNFKSTQHYYKIIMARAGL